MIQSFTAPLPSCPECGGETRKIPSSFATGGTATVPPPPERMPQTWKGTCYGDRDYVTTLRRTAETRQKLEGKHPELAGDRRPVVAHEGRYEAAPLRVATCCPPPPEPRAQPLGHRFPWRDREAHRVWLGTRPPGLLRRDVGEWDRRPRRAGALPCHGPGPPAVAPP
ncbi:hypothetical protein ACFQWA_25105 [Streptomyces thermogriseus]|uniref:hypothetical protein n=1 Tax=Streptomyces thermogriseus TaxID=75292 RepID=UPI0036195707